MRLDPAVRIARFIGKESGIPEAEMDQWYDEVVLGSMPINEFFSNIKSRVTDEALKVNLRGLMRSLPLF